MTPAERALLLAVGQYAFAILSRFKDIELRDLIAAVEAEAADRRPLGEPCRSCTGHIRENNQKRCQECQPWTNQNYVARDDTWNPGEEVAEKARAIEKHCKNIPTPEYFQALLDGAQAVRAALEGDVGKPCANCGHNREEDLTYACVIEWPFGFDGDDNCRDWQPKPPICPTCGGDGRDIAGGRYVNCTDCNGTGKKEKTMTKYKIVPVEPTEDMTKAGCVTWGDMLAAAIRAEKEAGHA